MKHKNSHLLMGYWSRLRAGRAVPDQTDIDPRHIKRLLPNTFILEMSDPQRPVYRLAGTGLCERFGYELRGAGFLAHWDTKCSLAILSVLRDALAQNSPVCLSAVATNEYCGMVETEMLLAPVSFNGETPTRFIGLLQVLGDANTLAGRPITVQRLAGTQIITENEPLSGYDRMEPPPPPPPPGGFWRHPRAPYLRLVVDRDAPASRTGTHHMDAFFQQMLGLFSHTPTANSDDLLKLR